MTKPKPKPLGTSIDVPEGATVVRPGTTEATTITGGVYVLDVPGVHNIDGTDVTAGVDDSEAPPTP